MFRTKNSGSASGRRSLAGWKFTRRSAAVAVALLMVAAPAGASLVVQNLAQAEITAADACFQTVAGNDPITSSLVSFSADPLVDVVNNNGVDLLQEKITISGMTGERVVFTDVVRYINTCTEDVSISLGNAVTSGDWSSLAAEIWISNVDGPNVLDPENEGFSADDWNDDHITIPAGSLGATTDRTGVVVIPAGGSIQGAFIVSAGIGFAGGTATVDWSTLITIGA